MGGYGEPHGDGFARLVPLLQILGKLHDFLGVADEVLYRGPLALVRTMAVKMVGIDAEGLCGMLCARGKEVKIF